MNEYEIPTNYNGLFPLYPRPEGVYNIETPQYFFTYIKKRLFIDNVFRSVERSKNKLIYKHG